MTLFDNLWNDDFELFKLALTKDNIDSLDEYYRTLLYVACCYKRKKFVELLISKGADINQRSIRNESCLFAACFAKDLDLVKYLISKGADIDIKNYYGETCLDHVSKFSLKELQEIKEYLQLVKRFKNG